MFQAFFTLSIHRVVITIPDDHYQSTPVKVVTAAGDNSVGNGRHCFGRALNCACTVGEATLYVQSQLQSYSVVAWYHAATAFVLACFFIIHDQWSSCASVVYTRLDMELASNYM